MFPQCSSNLDHISQSIQFPWLEFIESVFNIAFKSHPLEFDEPHLYMTTVLLVFYMLIYSMYYTNDTVI